MKVRVNSNRIQELRMQRGWTQERLAEEASLSARTVQRIEHGDSASMESVRVLAEIFDVRIGDLLADPVRTHFSAPWSRKLQITTAVFIVVILAATVPLGSAVSWVGPGILLFAAVFSVRGYSVVDGEVLVHRLGWSTHLDLSRVKHIEASPNIMLGSVRLMGVGGLFAFLGTFRNEMLGVYRAYATDGSNAVLLEMDGSKVIVTPDSPAEFVESVSSRLRAAA